MTLLFFFRISISEVFLILFCPIPQSCWVNEFFLIYSMEASVRIIGELLNNGIYAPNPLIAPRIFGTRRSNINNLTEIGVVVQLAIITLIITFIMIG